MNMSKLKSPLFCRFPIAGIILFLFLTNCASPRPASSVGGNKDIHPEAAPPTRLLPPPLQAGDTVAIIAPAGYVTDKNRYIERADSLLRAWGLVPVHGRYLFARHFQFAGTDQQRAADLQWALDAPYVKAVWAARGGYGSVRIVDKVDWSTFKRHPKWIVGFSDITVLLAKAYSEGVPSIHGIMPISLTNPDPRRHSAIVTLKNLLFGKPLKFVIPSDSLNIRGTGKGTVIGGNLSMLVSMLGSDLQPDTRGKILFLEDVGEYPYSYDRMLYALARAGFFDHLAGLIVGNMHTKKGNEAFGESVKEMILKHVRDKNYPVIFSFPAGHVIKNYAVPIGKTAKIKVGIKKTKVEFY